MGIKAATLVVLALVLAGCGAVPTGPATVVPAAHLLGDHGCQIIANNGSNVTSRTR